MAQFEITAPNGEKFLITAPENASEKDVLAYAANQFNKQQTTQTVAPVNPVEDMSTGKRFVSGMGVGLSNIGRGVGQRLREGLEFVSPPSKGLGQDITGNRGGAASDVLGLPTEQDIIASRQANAPLLNTTAGQAGNVTGQVLGLAPTAFIPGANTYGGAAALGALTGFLTPTAGDESRLANIGIGAGGGVVGQKIGNVLTKALSRPTQQATRNLGQQAASQAEAELSGEALARGVGRGYNYGYVGDDISAGLNASRKEALKKGTQLGFKVTPGQATGSKSLQQLEAKLESQPMTSGTFNEIKAKNQTVLNRVAAKAIGEKSDVVDSALLGKAQERIGGVYKLVADDKPRMINADDFLSKLSAIEDEFEGLATVTDNVLVNKFLNYATKGEITGKQAQDLASKLGKVATNNMTSPSGDKALGLALYQVKDQVDDVLQQGLSGKTAKAFADARSQYRNLMLLTQRSGVINPSSGDVNGVALAGLLQQKDKTGFLFNKNNTDLFNAARFAQAFKPLVGDSGTATRSVVPSPTDFLLSLPFSMATKAYTSTPVINAMTGTGNVNRFLRQGVIDQEKLKYLSPSSGLLGGVLSQQ
jgi:hypothetical protein